MEEFEREASSVDSKRDLCINRLAAIDGIAKKTAEALYAIGVRGYADLVQYLSQHTAEEVSAALKEHGVNRPAGFINRETWIRQAELFSQVETVVPTEPQEETAPMETPQDVPSSRTSQEEVLRDPDPIQTGGAAPITPEAPNDVQLEISDVHLTATGPTSDVPEKQLRAEIRFQLTSSAAEALASQGIPFRIEAYTLDVESGDLKLVASDRSQLTPQVFEYVVQQEFSMPDVGRYEFYSIVLLLPPGKVATYHCGPIFRIVP
jgi:hypothetical protein